MILPVSASDISQALPDRVIGLGMCSVVGVVGGWSLKFVSFVDMSNVEEEVKGTAAGRESGCEGDVSVLGTVTIFTAVGLCMVVVVEGIVFIVGGTVPTIIWCPSGFRLSVNEVATIDGVGMVIVLQSNGAI